MIAFRADLKIWVVAQPADFRKSIPTLSALVSEALRANPYGGEAAAKFIGQWAPRSTPSTHSKSTHTWLTFLTIWRKRSSPL